MAEVAVHGALLPQLSKAISESDSEKQAWLVAQGLRNYSRIALFSILAGLAASPALPYLIPVSTPNQESVRSAYFLGLTTFLFMLLRPVNAWCESSQRNYWVNMIQIFTGVASMGLAMVFAYLGWGIVGQVGSTILPTLIGLTILWLIVSQKVPHIISFAFSSKIPQTIRDASWQQSRPVLMMSVFGQLSLWSDNLIVSVINGAESVTAFSLTQRLTLLMHNILISISSAAWPGLSELYHRGEHELMCERLLEVTRLTAILGMAAFIAIFCSNEAFVTHWVGKDKYVNDFLTAAACFVALFQALFVVWGMCLQGAGKISAMVPVFAAQTVINVGASVGLTWWLGLTGPVLGTLVSFVLITLWWLPKILNRELGVPGLALACAFLIPIFSGLLCAAGARAITLQFAPQSWPEIIGAMLGFSGLWMVFAWFVLLSAGERKLWSARVLKRFSRRNEPVSAS